MGDLKALLENLDRDNSSTMNEHLGGVELLEIAVLRGHLLVEQKVGALLEAYSGTAPKVVLAHLGRLSFNKKLQLLRDFWLEFRVFQEGAYSALWGLLGALGEVRNAIAHQLEGEGWHQKLKVLRQKYVELKRVSASSGEGADPAESTEEPEDDLDLINWVSWNCCSLLTLHLGLFAVQARATKPERLN